MGTRNTEVMLRLLHDVHRILKDQAAEFLDRQGIPMSTVVILRHLGDSPGLTVTKLGQKSGLSKGYVSVLADQLETDGLVTKSPDPDDQRRKRLELSKAGHDFRAKLERMHLDFLQEYLHAIPGSQIEAMIAGLQYLRAAFTRTSS